MPKKVKNVTKNDKNIPKKGKKTPKTEEEITEADLKNTFFVPMKCMKEIIDNANVKERPNNERCEYSLLSLKRERSTRDYFDENHERYASLRHRALFVSTCYKALYAHDWDRLLHVLKRVPRWRFKKMHEFYLRMLTILLMYHPESQKHGFYNEYLHMVWGCRTIQDKKAIQKTVLTLSKKMYRTLHLQKFIRASEEQRKRALAEMAQKKELNIFPTKIQ